MIYHNKLPTGSGRSNQYPTAPERMNKHNRRFAFPNGGSPGLLGEPVLPLKGKNLTREVRRRLPD
jgi:hypothetical protein